MLLRLASHVPNSCSSSSISSNISHWPPLDDAVMRKIVAVGWSQRRETVAELRSRQ